MPSIIMTREEAIALGLGDQWPKEVRTPSKAPADGMNKTENRLADILRWMKDQKEIIDWAFEPEKFRLADRTFLTPDFRVTLLNHQNVFIECKGGFIRDDAIVKLKVVAETHPYVFFLAVFKDRHWTITRLPSRTWSGIKAEIAWHT